MLSSCPGLSFPAAFRSHKLDHGRKVMSQGEASPVLGAAAEPEDIFGPESASISVFPPSLSR